MSLISIIIVVLVLAIIFFNIRIVNQSKAYVVERLGAYYTTWNVGIHVKIPIIDAIRKVISLKEQVIDFPPQPVITKDNVTLNVDTVIYYQITDPKAFAYGVEKPIMAIENLTATTLRNIMGDLELDESLTSRDVINTKMRVVLDEATDKWGIKVNRVEVKNIVPPKDIQEAMEKQMRAERERRESILRAEGEKRSSILQAEGLRESEILKAEAQKQSNILKAEGEAISIIKKAKAQAEAVEIEYDALSKGLNELKSVQINKELIAYKSLDSLEKVANGQATKIIIPSEIQNMVSLVEVLKDMADK